MSEEPITIEGKKNNDEKVQLDITCANQKSLILGVDPMIQYIKCYNCFEMKHHGTKYSNKSSSIERISFPCEKWDRIIWVVL